MGDMLRGGLPADSLGARGIEKAARSVRCLRRMAILVAGLSPETVAREAYGDPDCGFVSPFAISAGLRFETRMVALGAADLIGLYRAEGRLSSGECKVVNLADLFPDENSAALGLRNESTRLLLKMKLSGNPDAPNLILKGRLDIRLFGRTHIVEPDGLVAPDASPFYLPIEMKSFPDREGKTPSSELRGALRQAAVSVLGLRQYLGQQGVVAPERIASPTVDLILRGGYANRASLRPMTVESEVLSIGRLVDSEARIMSLLPGEFVSATAPYDLSDRRFLESIPNTLTERCREHCELAERCRQEGRMKGDLSVLGQKAQEYFGGAGSIGRSIELFRGIGDPPSTESERQLRERMGEVVRILDGGVAHAG